jgi:hypothetical protein
LLARQTALDTELRRYQELQDLYTRGSLGLFALNAALQRLSAAAGPHGDAGAELRDLEGELESLRQDAAADPV